MAIYLQGYKQLQVKLNAAPRRARYKLGKQFYIEAMKVMEISQAVYVPIDSGALVDSGFVKKPRLLGLFGVDVVFGYGKGNKSKAYATIQHEDLSLHHPPLRRKKHGYSGRAGQAKYLSTPFAISVPGIVMRLGLATDTIFTGKS